MPNPNAKSEGSIPLIALEGVVLGAIGVLIVMVGTLRFIPATHWYTQGLGWLLLLFGFGMMSNRHRDQPHRGARAGVYFAGVIAGLLTVFGFAYDPIDRWAKVALHEHGVLPHTVASLDHDFVGAILSGDIHDAEAMLKTLAKKPADPSLQPVIDEVNHQLLQAPWSNVFLMSHGQTRIEFVKLFLRYGFEANTRISSTMPSFRFMDSPLGFALDQGDLELAKVLVEKGAVVDNPQKQSARRTTHAVKPASGATSRPATAPATETAADSLPVYRTHGPKALWHTPYSLKDTTDDYGSRSEVGMRLLFRFAGKDNLPAVQFLVEHGANVNRPEDEMPLWIAVEMGRAQTVDYLLSKGADPNIKGPDGEDLLTAGANMGILVAADVRAHITQAIIKARGRTQDRLGGSGLE